MGIEAKTFYLELTSRNGVRLEICERGRGYMSRTKLLDGEVWWFIEVLQEITDKDKGDKWFWKVREKDCIPCWAQTGESQWTISEGESLCPDR